MRKSIFSKLMLTNLAITFMCLLITGGILFGTLIYYITDQKKRDLTEDANRINDITVYQFSGPQTSISRNLYNMNIENASKRLGGVIMILDTQGKIVVASSNLEQHVTSKAINKNIINKILSDEGFSAFGDLNGMFRGPHLTISVPLFFENIKVGTTCISVPAPEVNGIIYDILRIFILTAITAMIIVVVLSYLIHKRIANPLKRLSLAANKVSLGEYNVRVDVTGEDEVANLCKTFNNMTESLHKIEQMRSDFIANVSHELRTPMTTIAGFVDGIIDGTVPDEKKAQYLSIVSDEVKRLGRLVSELLMLTRLEAGEIKLNISEFDINELIRITIIRTESRLREKNINVDVDFDTEKQIVRADKDAISRVLINLLDNAVKFNFNDGYIKIKTGKKGGKVTVSIENSGIGISEDERMSVWERFYKTDKSRSQDKKGLGIGLYLVHNILAEHGESIEVESKQNEYAKFTFTLEKN